MAGEKAVDQLIHDKIVVELGYDTIDSIAKYLRPASPYYAECMALGGWIDACWIKCHELFNAGEPLTIDEIITAMPEFTTP